MPEEEAAEIDPGVAKEEDKEDMAVTSPTKNKRKTKKAANAESLIHLYDSDLQSVFSGIRPVPAVFGGGGVAVGQSNRQEKKEDNTDGELPSVSSSTSCSICDVVFDSLSEQRQHSKLDWHRYNLKQRLLDDCRDPVTEAAFEKMVVADETAEECDRMSLSGSEEDDEDEEVLEEAEAVAGEDDDDGAVARRRRHPWVFFENGDGKLFSVHKCVLAAPASNDDDDEGGEDEEFNLVRSVPRGIGGGSVAVFMLGGGHFAGAVFRGREAVLHKTFHCYTVRAKQGGSQSGADNKAGGKHPKSAGASLRRCPHLLITGTILSPI